MSRRISFSRDSLSALVDSLAFQYARAISARRKMSGRSAFARPRVKYRLRRHRMALGLDLRHKSLSASSSNARFAHRSGAWPWFARDCFSAPARNVRVPAARRTAVPPGLPNLGTCICGYSRRRSNGFPRVMHSSSDSTPAPAGTPSPSQPWPQVHRRQDKIPLGRSSSTLLPESARPRFLLPQSST
jgi:hypothetical protein